MNKLLLIAGGSTTIYACLAWIMGVWPGIELSKVPAGPGVEPLTALQSEGREVYVANGCSYCHTQQVRPLTEDKVFGRASAPGDFAYQTPELLGSERTGPDLTNIGVRQPSSVWQYIHLYQPRAVVPESIMPSFSWMFAVVAQAPSGVSAVPLPKRYAPAAGVVIPTHQTEALIAYLASLKQPDLPPAASSGGGPSTAGTVASAKPAPEITAPARGASLYAANCSACHQSSGEGLAGAFPPLKGDNVVNDDDATTHVRAVLLGVHDAKVGGTMYGSAMPPFASSLDDAQIADIIDYERVSWGNHGKPVTAAQVAAERAKSK